ncbi:MAG: hypothetical protein ACLRFL_02200 [Clostridia bacterium]
MAIRKTASKTVKKAELDIDINKKSSKKTSKKVTKTIKKLSPAVIFMAVILLAVGAVGGYFGFSFLIKDDCFEILGKDEITLFIGDPYEDDGCKVIAFGRDESDKLKMETNLTKNNDGTYTSNEEGTFYMVYTVDNLKYGTLFKIQKIRLISFVEPSEPDEIASANQ